MKRFFTILALVAFGQTSFAFDFQDSTAAGWLRFNINSDGYSVSIVHHENNRYLRGNLIIPDSVTYNGTTYVVSAIGFQGLKGASQLTSITIPKTITQIGIDAFDFYLGQYLSEVHYLGTVDQWCKITFKNVYSNPTYCFGNNRTPNLIFDSVQTTDLVISDSITEIKRYTFIKAANITSITLPNSVTIIGDSAFYGCSGLISITIPNTVTSIGNSSFYGCSSLNSITLSESITSLNSNIFSRCTALTSISIPNAVNSIGVAAFSACDHLTNITFGEGLTNINDNAFNGCTQMVRMVSHALNAPTVSSSTFNGLRDSVILEVPCGSANSYENAAYWFRFDIREKLMHNFNATTSDPSRGTVTITTAPTCDNREAQVQANPYHGYHFDHWSDGNRDNPRYIVVLQDTSIEAFFNADNDTTGIDDVKTIDAKIYTRDGQIVVEGAEGESVCLYDMTGRLLAARREETHGGAPLRFDVPASGVYIVKIGTLAAQKVIIMR